MSTSGISIGRPTYWAILIGIDYYSADDWRKNLQGCVNDVVLIDRYLREHAGFQMQNITAFCAPLPHWNTPYPTSQTIMFREPKRKDIIAAIDKVYDSAKKGDFLLISYSGHGDERRTRYPGRKGINANDELLCFLGGDYSDVKFGRQLDRLAKKLTVLVTLDCCHSGGATRGEKLEGVRVRCWPATVPRKWSKSEDFEQDDSEDDADTVNHEPDSIESIQEGGITEPDTKRNAKVHQSYLYRSSRYNVLAAVQPHQLARETYRDGAYHGRWTRAYIDALHYLGHRREMHTYATLHEQLSAAMKLFSDEMEQVPAHLGDGRRFIFQKALCDTLEANDESLPVVLSVDGARIMLDRGKRSGLRKGDKFRLYHPTQSGASSSKRDGNNLLLTVSVLSQSKAGGDIESSKDLTLPVQRGWRAVLVWREEYTLVRMIRAREVDMSLSELQAWDSIQKTWQMYIDPTVRIELDFNETSTDNTNLDLRPPVDEPSFRVKLQESAFTFHDASGARLEHFPVLHINEPELSKRLMSLLHHLQRYYTVAKLRSTNRNAPTTPNFRFEITEYEEEDDEEPIPQHVVSTKQLVVTNSSNKDLFFTVLNMTPLYGIKKLLPHKHGLTAERILPGKEAASIISIEVPLQLREQWKTAGTEMKDVFVLLISDRTPGTGDYAMYELPELTSTMGSWRTAVVRQKSRSEQWWVQHLSVVQISQGTG
ncbi:hypothetical protein BS50DRAFT_584465 [Corynespora cassiicola Philippines]|uniref:Peptidase C14 caspase domain-containing protein n=1 Tax=Corynespora cassiicola Philippines TaxID=1448308 RepID=A0A2T2NZV0_CORCC|nr:hypothetical protein BS50DRAFT_584465 [Corynespora cassiicola Philippines]